MVETVEEHLGHAWLYAEGAEELLFTENESATMKLWGKESPSPYVKDAFHEYIVHGDKAAINPAQTGTKAAAHFPLEIPPGGKCEMRLRLTDQAPANGLTSDAAFGKSFDDLFALRQNEADDFYAHISRHPMSDDAKQVSRQALAGLHDLSIISLLKRTRSSVSPGTTSLAPETGYVSTATGGWSSKVGTRTDLPVFSSASVTADSNLRSYTIAIASC